MTVMLVLVFFCAFWMIDLLTGRRAGEYAISGVPSGSAEGTQMVSADPLPDRRRGARRSAQSQDRRKAA
jgi:hypothetical protein